MSRWLWYRPATIAPIQPLAWELPYAVGAALKRPKKKTSWLNVIAASVVLEDNWKEFVLQITNIYPGLWFTLLIYIKELY